jgi:hypothetical protein
MARKINVLDQKIRTRKIMRMHNHKPRRVPQYAWKQERRPERLFRSSSWAAHSDHLARNINYILDVHCEFNELEANPTRSTTSNKLPLHVYLHCRLNVHNFVLASHFVSISMARQCFTKRREVWTVPCLISTGNTASERCHTLFTGCLRSRVQLSL